jgi:ribonuclease D
LSNELTRRKKGGKLSEEMKKLDSVKDIYKIDNAWKKIRINKSKSVDLNLLKKIAKWREKKAQSLNLPRNWIVSDKILIKAAKKIKTSELNDFSKNKKLNSYLKDFICLLEAKKFI